MRDTSRWRARILRALQAQWPTEAVDVTPRVVCDVELGLSLVRAVVPGEPVTVLPTLLSGYPFPAIACAAWSDAQRRIVATARHLLLPYRNPTAWRKEIVRYQSLPERLRAYDVAVDLSCVVPKPVSVCSDRYRLYSDALTHPAPHRTKPVRLAEAGEYEFSSRGRLLSVVIPKDLTFPLPPGHQLADAAGRTKREPWMIPWGELRATACWMDGEIARRGLPPEFWANRLAKIQLEVLEAPTGALHPSDTLPLDRTANYVGMVSSGKSTLMDILAVWAARSKQRVTLIVPDVMSALNRAHLFVSLGLRAAPILGNSNRVRHTNRLHRVLASERPLDPLPVAHEGFRWLSTACPLDGLRDTFRPLEAGAAPCFELVPRSDDEGPTDTPGKTAQPAVCPLYGVCPYHQAQRDLVDASIWIATPASLVYTRVAPPLCAERIRFAELVYRRSDLVIIDEADQVQVQLDHIFNPSQTLVSPRQDAWLGRLQQQVVVQLNQQGRGQLVDEGVDSWCQGHGLAQIATDRIYARLLRSDALRAWVETSNYFTDLNLLYQLARSLAGVTDADEAERSEVFAQVTRAFDEFIEDPLNESGDQPLGEVALQLVTLSDEGKARRRLREWVTSHKAASVVLTDAGLSALAEKLGFALLVAVLHNRLAKLLREWRQVEAQLALEETGSILFHKPPEDYAALLPEPPMGQVLAFQYVRTEADPTKPGDLRFFRCTGVGRWLLLHFHELFAGDGIAGPHVLLLSGTSWAGSSPSYHIQAPVTGVLRAPDEEVEAIARSKFEFYPLYDQSQRPISVSGRQGADRVAALQELLQQLARPNGFGGSSLLEQERDRLPPDRRRLLLVVGSYEEARAAYDYLCKRRPDWTGGLRYLVTDDTVFEAEWHGGGTERPALQRGLVHHLASTEAWILIAPLLAVERGHNILTESRTRAAIGAAYFLVRPHPRPDDIGFAIHSINHWAIAHHQNVDWLSANPRDRLAAPHLADIGTAFRQDAFQRWRALLRLPMRYSTLPDEEREAVTWSQLVSIWQVIGRLVRGGSEAHVYFCDAAFAPRTASTAEIEPDAANSSLLLGMREVLAPYFNDVAQPAGCGFVQTLYGPFYAALEKMGGIPSDVS